MLDVAYDPPKSASKNEGQQKQPKPFVWIIIDSIIIASIALLASLPSDRLPSLLDLYTALKAFLYSFVVQLAVERGLKPLVKGKGNEEGEAKQ
jgi:hypothetical protein